MRPTLLSLLLLAACEADCYDCGPCGLIGGPNTETLLVAVGGTVADAPAVGFEAEIEGECGSARQDGYLAWQDGVASFETASFEPDDADALERLPVEWDGVTAESEQDGLGVIVRFIAADGGSAWACERVDKGVMCERG